jgi:hypothetical protein
MMSIISDYVPSTAPMVPALIVHCVNEVDLHGLDDTGIYRISGIEKDVMKLKVQNIYMLQSFLSHSVIQEVACLLWNQKFITIFTRACHQFLS